MPITNANGIDLYYEIHGEGEPLLLIMGLSLHSKSWFRTVPALSEKYKVIIFDNRGVGLSGKPNTPYSIELMAEDARAVLDASGVETAHVYGISMGGMIAQRLALKYPERIRSLILGCTTPGGVDHVQPSSDVAMLMLSRASSIATPEEMAWASVPILYSQFFIENHRDRIAEDIQKRIELPVQPYAYMLQLQACMAHDTSSEIDQITVPTLVIHGNEDRLVPYQNGVTLAENINGAEFLTIQGAGHIYVTEAVDLVNKKILEFLGKQ
ncbi:alpha/beta hydrolase [Neobacillus sp. MM2021_6]|uniref:alpha/beta fold hydrolase n=1 Tax=Bacillaceae TaxID=186817 RepID=UPI00140AB7E5|nr:MULTISPECIES: alpha/beta hydrolase [Bacillaceae]MBO0960438.1 alpha/beta hydrolase [Neobacillus sp. MM2021_6]NHC16705.1 alpha/beta hydrolase [Bacillus sp. MM2020_4]WML38838.1 alpha/beta hydrolase [Neobacillus sp. OS1-2]